MQSKVLFEQVRVADFRNISELEFAPTPRINVIAGDNGQGKTSLLEALYVLATSKSFRTDRGAELIRTSSEQALIRGTISDAGLRREQRALLRPRSRVYFQDGKRAARLGSYAVRTPVVVFHPGDLELVSGGASSRRRLLDRVALYVTPASADARVRFEKALKDRQRTLEQRGTSAPELDAYEQLIAQHGSELSRARRDAASRIGDVLIDNFRALAAPDLALAANYRPGGCDEPAEFLRELAQRRPQDYRRGAASFGPHRDDYELNIDGRSARQHASQGQQRVLTLALKAAELRCVELARGALPILLLDDVSSELDPSRTGAVYEFVRNLDSQVFVTTTRPDLFVTPELGPDARSDWVMEQGRLQSSSPASKYAT